MGFGQNRSVGVLGFFLFFVLLIVVLSVLVFVLVLNWGCPMASLPSGLPFPLIGGVGFGVTGSVVRPTVPFHRTADVVYGDIARLRLVFFITSVISGPLRSDARLNGV